MTPRDGPDARPRRIGLVKGRIQAAGAEPIPLRRQAASP
jgi:hypothetical protein